MLQSQAISSTENSAEPKFRVWFKQPSANAEFSRVKHYEKWVEPLLPSLSAMVWVWLRLKLRVPPSAQMTQNPLTERGMSTSLVIAFFVAGGAAVWIGQYAARQRVLRRMYSRPARTVDEFGRDLFPPETAHIASTIRQILGRYLTIDLSKLSPDDTFVDLEIAELDSLVMVGLARDLEREFGIKVLSEDFERLKTIGDLVRYVSMNLTRQP